MSGLGRRRWTSPGEQLVSLLEGQSGLQDLKLPLADFYNLGYFDGRASLAAALAEAQCAADRYYRRAFDPAFRPPVIPDVTFSQRCRIRGEFSRAARAEEALARRFDDAFEVA